MTKTKKFDLNIKFEDRSIFKCKNKTFDDLEGTIKELKRKFR